MFLGSSEEIHLKPFKSLLSYSTQMFDYETDLNPLDPDLYLNLHQIAHTHRFQPPKHPWLFSSRSMNYSLRNIQTNLLFPDSKESWKTNQHQNLKGSYLTHVPPEFGDNPSGGFYVILRTNKPTDEIITSSLEVKTTLAWSRWSVKLLYWVKLCCDLFNTGRKPSMDWFLIENTLFKKHTNIRAVKNKSFLDSFSVLLTSIRPPSIYIE